MALGHGGQPGAEIGGVAGHHAEIRELAELIGRHFVRHAAQRRLQAIDAAAGRGDAA